MVDMETMSVTPRAVILSIGAVQFNPYDKGIINEFYIRVNFDDQHDLGREIDPNTLDWWAKQDVDIMEEAFSPEGRIPFKDAIDQFHKFAWGCDAFWSHGATFDLVILEDCYRQLNKPLAWNYWQLRDTRTLFDLGYEPEMPKENKHDALADAIRQAIGVQNVYSKLRISKN